MGSGATGVACKLEQRQFVGIDREEEYVADAKRRIEDAQAEEQSADERDQLSFPDVTA
jgi:DNA modification methylase